MLLKPAKTRNTFAPLTSHTMDFNIRHAKTFSVFLLSLVLFVSCKKDIKTPPANPGPPVVSKIQFSADHHEIIDNGNDLEIEILLQPKPTRPGSIVIKVEDENAIYLKDYILIPGRENEKISIPFEAGRERVTFRLKTSDDKDYNEERKVKFTLEEIEGSNLKPEGKISNTVKIIDDERHSGIRFQETHASVSENERDGYEVKFLIEPAAKEAGYIEVDVNEIHALYAVHYSTNPAFIQGKLRLPVQAGDESVSFMVIPFQDYVINDTRKLKFKITDATGQLRPDYLKELELFILDNGQTGRLSIRSIHDAYRGEELYYLFPTTISGRVISMNDNVSPRTAFIEDETGGIAVEFMGNNTAKMGEMVTIAIENGKVSERNEMLTIQQIPNDNLVGQGIELWVIPELTLEQLNQKPEYYEGRMILLKNVSFPEANGSKVMEGIQTIQSNNQEARVLVNNFASFKNKIIPTGPVSIRGILVWSRNGYYTIIPQRGQDIF
jgi:hypothetical protein